MFVAPIKEGVDVPHYIKGHFLNSADEKQMQSLCVCLHELFDKKNKYKGENAYKKIESKIINATHHIKYFNDALLKLLNDRIKFKNLVETSDEKITASLKKDITQIKQAAEELQVLIEILNTAMGAYWAGRFKSRAPMHMPFHEEKMIVTTFKQLELASKNVDAANEKFAKTALDILKRADNLLGRLTRKSNEMSNNKLYQNYIYSESMNCIKEQWEKHVKDKTDWLFHGTSVLFLPSIKIYGLDNKKLPRGMKRAIEGISKVINKYGGKKEGPALDIFEEMSKKKISIAPHIPACGISSAARAESLPSFLYELLNKDYVLKNFQEIIEQLTPEERRICEVAWRFGRILRGKNKIVLLHIKFGSEYLQLVRFPDYFSDFDAFYKLLKRSIPKEFLPEKNELLAYKKIYYAESLLMDAMGRKYEKIGGGKVRAVPDLVMFYFVKASPLRKLGALGLLGPRELWAKSIPPEFIFLRIKTQTGIKMINIKEWETDMDLVLEK